MLQNSRMISYFLALALALTACVPAASETVVLPEPTEIPAIPTVEVILPTVPPTVPPEAQPRPEGTPITTEPLLSLRARVAEQLRLNAEEISLIEMRAETWSDGCLGAALPGEMCTMALVPGYLIYLATPRGEVEVHTDESMRIFRIAPGLMIGGGSSLVSWNRSGGIAGICWQMHIYTDGAYQIQDCANQQMLAQGSLTSQALEELLSISGGMAPHEWATPQVQGADMFTESYLWFGPGNQPPTAAAQEQLNAYLGGLASLLAK